MLSITHFIISEDVPNNPRRQVLLISCFYREGNWASENSRNLPIATELRIGRLWICVQDSWVQKPCSLYREGKQSNTEHTCTRAWDGGSRNDFFHWLECLLLLIYSTGILEASALPLYLPLPLKHTHRNSCWLWVLSFYASRVFSKN